MARTHAGGKAGEHTRPPKIWQALSETSVATRVCLNLSRAIAPASRLFCSVAFILVIWYVRSSSIECTDSTSATIAACAKRGRAAETDRMEFPVCLSKQAQMNSLRKLVHPRWPTGTTQEKGKGTAVYGQRESATGSAPASAG